jgi:hypothetical protein
MVVPFEGGALARGLLGVFLGEGDARHDADDSDTCEENKKCQGVSARNFSEPKQEEAGD